MNPARSADRKARQAFGWRLGLMCVALTAVIAFAGWSYLQRQQAQAREAAYQQLATIADLKVQQIVNWRKERLADARMIRATPYAARRALDALTQPESARTRKMFTDWLDSFLAVGSYERALLLDDQLQLQLVHPATQKRPELAAAMLESAKEALQSREVVVADLHPDGDRRHIHLDLIVPFVVHREGNKEEVPATGLPASPSDRSAGVLVLQINAADFLFPLIQSWPTPSPSAETVLARPEGDRVVYLNELRHRTNTVLTLRLPLSTPQLPVARWFRGEGDMCEGLDYRGVPVVAAVRAVPESKWVMVSKVDQAELYAPLRQHAWVTVTSTALALLVASLGLVVLWRRRHERFLREQLASEQARRTLAERFEHLMKNASDAILLADDQNRILEANDRASILYGYSLAELQGLPLIQLCAPELREEFARQSEAMLANGFDLLETRHLRRDGSTFPVEISSRTVEIEGARCELSIIRDITERKQAESALHQSEQRFRSLLTLSPVAMGLVNRDGTISFLNDRFTQLFGYTIENVPTLADWWRLAYPDEAYRDLVIESWSAAVDLEVRSRGAASPREWNIRCRVGSERVVQISSLAIGDGVLASFVDLTDRKRAEEALRVSELNARQRAEELQTLMDLAPLAIWVAHDPECRRITGNRAANAFYEADPDENVSAGPASGGEHDTTRRFFRDGRELTPDELPMQEAVRKNQEVRGIELTVQRPSGLAFTMLGNASPLHNEQGRVRGCIGCFVDITERKRAEEALIQSERQLQAAQAVAHIGSWHLDLAQDRLTWSAEVCRIFARPAPPHTYEEFLRCIHPEDRAALRQAWQATLGGAPYDLEHRILADGDIKWVHQKAVLEPGDHGQPAACLGTVQDITERKRMEAALRATEERLRFALDQSGTGGWDLDLVNHTAHRTLKHDQIFGYESLLPQWTYEMFLEHVLPEDLAEVDRRFQQATQTQTNWNFECRIRRRDGAVCWIWAAGGFHTDVAGQAHRMAGIVQDITERKRAEAALHDREQELRLLINTTPALISYIGADYCYRRVNRSYENWFGHSAECVRGRHVREVLGTAAWEAVRPYMDRALAGETVTYERALPYRDGGTRWMYVTYTPDRDASGHVCGFVVHGVDIGELKRVQAEIQKLNAELEQRVRDRTAKLEAANKELEAFSYSVSHDLRAPLRGMDGFVRILQEDYGSRLDAEGNRLINVVSSEAKRMGRLIDDLLAFSRLGRQRMETTAVDMTHLAQSVFDSLVNAAPNPVCLDLKPLPPARGDLALLRQVFANLLGNALKFSRLQATPIIEVGATSLDGTVTFYVKDNGVGFDARYAHKLFGVFQRLHSEEEFEGTGVGLALVQRVIHRHGGRVWAESQPGAGATFYFSLPTENVTKP